MSLGIMVWIVRSMVATKIAILTGSALQISSAIVLVAGLGSTARILFVCSIAPATADAPVRANVLAMLVGLGLIANLLWLHCLGELLCRWQLSLKMQTFLLRFLISTLTLCTLALGQALL